MLHNSYIANIANVQGGKKASNLNSNVGGVGSRSTPRLVRACMRACMCACMCASMCASMCACMCACLCASRHVFRREQREGGWRSQTEDREVQAWQGGAGTSIAGAADVVARGVCQAVAEA